MSDNIDQAPCPADMVERVAKVLEDSLWSDPSPHGCRLEGPRDGKDVIVYGHVSLDALARAAIAVLPQSSGGWQPIATAPKRPPDDQARGPFIIALTDFEIPIAVRFDAAQDAWCLPTGNVWRKPITHWAPIPPAPSEQEC